MKDHSLFYKAKRSLLVCRQVNSSFISIPFPQHYKQIDILEVKLKTLGNYSLDENRRQTFDSSAKKYFYEPFLERPPIVSLIDNDAIEVYKDDQIPIGCCFYIIIVTVPYGVGHCKMFSFFYFYFFEIDFFLAVCGVGQKSALAPAFFKNWLLLRSWRPELSNYLECQIIIYCRQIII